MNQNFQFMSVVNLQDKFASFHDHWHPRIVGALNGQEVKLAKLKGEFVRHQHEAEDEMFLVIEGRLIMRYDDREEIIEAGEFVIVPRGVYHQPIAPEEVKVMLFEPAGTLNTGDADSDRSRPDLERI